MFEPGQKLRSENLLLAVKSIARKPDQLFLGEAQGARIIQLVSQLPLINDSCQTNALGTVDHAERRAHIAMARMDGLQHQQLIKIRVEQRAHDGVEFPRMVIDPFGDIDVTWHSERLSLDPSA